MKAILYLILIMLFPITTYGQEDYYIQNGHSKSLHYGRYIENFAVSINVGSMNMPRLGSKVIGGFECTIWNFYFDYMGAPAGHSHSVKVGKWGNETQGTTYHFGYRINVYRNLGITPLIGKATMELGTVDGYDYSISNDGKISNSFIVNDRECYTDYGAIVSYDFGKIRDNHSDTCFKLSLGFTKHCIFGGIGVSIK